MNIEKMISTIDTHVAGEIFRIVLHASIILNEKDIKSNHHLLQGSFQSERELVLNEPRGHRGINGCVVIPSTVADYGLLFFNHDSEVQFQYGGLPATITALLETGNLVKKENNAYKIETLSGIYTIRAGFDNQEVSSVYLESKECRMVRKETEYSLVEVDGSRNYPVFALPAAIPEITFKHLSSISRWGRETTAAFTTDGVQFDGIIIAEPTRDSTNEVRSVTFEKDGCLLRSPGMDSTLAIFTAQRSTSNQQAKLTNRSIFDSVLTAKLIPDTKNRFSIETRAFTTGMHEFIYDQADPLKNGFLLK